MPIKTKLFLLNKNEYLLSNSKAYLESRWFFQMASGWSATRSDMTAMPAMGGDACISKNSTQIDGDLLLSVGWGDGFAIKRVNDDGTITQLYHDNTPMNGYAYYTSFAVDKVRKRAYVGTYSSSGLVEYDYSDLGNVTKVKLTASTDGLPAERFGTSYINGLALAGDYLYMTNNTAYHGQVLRWNIVTRQADNLDISGFRYTGRYGSVTYDEKNNRIFVHNHYNGEIWLVVNPDKASDDPVSPAKAFLINVEAVGLGNDMRIHGVVPDDNDANLLWIGGANGRIIQVRIDDIINGITNVPVVVKRDDRRYNDANMHGEYFNFWAYTKMFPHPVYGSDMTIFTPYGDWFMTFGWHDTENMLPIGMGRYYGQGFRRDIDGYTYPIHDNQLRMSYADIFRKVVTAGGNEYWVFSGYGWDGHKHWVLPANSFPNGYELATHSEIVFGQFKFDDSSNIGAVYLGNLTGNVYVLSGTSVTIYVSNNNGATWETYDYTRDEIHYFSSTGNSVQVKFVFDGLPTKSAHITSVAPVNVQIFQSHPLVETNFKQRTRMRIKGV